MLHVILQILAVIGIVLLCILGILLLVILLILFVPVRYRVMGHKKEEDLQLHVKVTYLLHMLSAKFSYPTPGKIIVRLFGFKIYDSGKTEESEDEPEKTEAPEGEPEKTEAPEGEPEKTEAPEGEPEKTEAPEDEPEKTETPEDNSDKAEVSEDGVGKSETEKKEEQYPIDKPVDEQKTSSEKESLLTKIKYTFQSICDKIKNIIEKMKDIFGNIAYYKDVITKIENQRLYSRLLKRIGKVLKSIRPRVIKADLRLGTGLPDTTAYIYGIYGMLMPLFGKNVKNINIDLDFEEKVCEGEIFIKGKITVFILLVQAIKIIKDKQLHIFIEQIKGRK